MSPLLRFLVAFQVFAVVGNVVLVALAVGTGRSLSFHDVLSLVLSVAMGAQVWLTMRWVRRGGRISWLNPVQERRFTRVVVGVVTLSLLVPGFFLFGPGADTSFRVSRGVIFGVWLGMPLLLGFYLMWLLSRDQ
jgi:hypothetical protein